MADLTHAELVRKFKEYSLPGIRPEIQDLIIERISDEELKQYLDYRESGDEGAAINLLFEIATRLMQIDNQTSLRLLFRRRYPGIDHDMQTLILHRITDKEIRQLFAFQDKHNDKAEEELIKKVMTRPWLN